MRGAAHRLGVWLAAAGCLIALLALAGDVSAQQRRQRATPVPVPQPQVRPVPVRPGDPADAGTALPRETVQADVSTRRVAVTSTFSGTEIVVFGAIDNSRQASPEAGLYDVVVVVLGTPTRLETRKKNRVLGVWLNTESMSFQSVPNYYSIVSTRPLDEIASEEVLKSQEIGFDYVPMTLGKGEESRSAAEVKAFRDAIVRLKRKEKLYSQDEYGVAFIGRSLFRASVDVPANVVVGPFDTRVFLFRNRELIHQYRARLDLAREGLEDALHAFAFRYPLIYGIATVMLAVGAGLLASAVFRKGAH